jgi:hypothetical protein
MGWLMVVSISMRLHEKVFMAIASSRNYTCCASIASRMALI